VFFKSKPINQFMKHTIPILLFFLLLYSPTKAQTEIFISPLGDDSNIGSLESPFRTFQKILNELRSMSDNMQDDIVVYVRKGTYYLEEPITIDEQISGTNGHQIIFKAYKNEKPLLSGGERLTELIPHENNIYKIYVGDKSFRQIYINDKKAIRARQPNSCDYYRLDWNRESKNVEVDFNDFHDVINPNSNNPVELVVQKIFACQIFRLKSFKNQSQVTLLHDNSKIALNLVKNDEEVFSERLNQITESQPYHLENSYQFLDASNEWYLDKESGYLYIYHEAPDSIKEIIVPRLSSILNIKGTAEDFVKNLSFEGLTFSHNNWTLPDSIGLFAGQATYLYEYGAKQPRTSGILVENAENINFTRNVISNMGSAGITFYAGVQNSRITGNAIKNIASNGIEIDRYWVKQHQNKRLHCSNIIIDNNLVTNVGTDYFGAVGIFSGYSDSILIEHNLLYKLPYTAISVGWGWTLTETNLRNNEIRYNIIDSPMSLLSDGAGIYTLSHQPGSKIHHNILVNIKKSIWGGAHFVAGIYLDKGSSQIQSYENVLRNVDRGYQFNTEGENFVITDNREWSKTTTFAGIRPQYLNILSEMPDEIPCFDSYFKGYHKEAENIDILLYPNPAENYIIVSDYNLLLAESVTYKIYNSIGSLLVERNFNKGRYKPLELDTSLLKSGAYILSISFGNFNSTMKFLKQ